jgi:uncharacterized flavoprotein (TIGR03862 family)
MPPSSTARIAVVGGGPAGLFAAETLAMQGVQVDLYDAMPSVGRKFLVAGRGGLNLTHGEPMETFRTRYRGPEMPEDCWVDWLTDFSPQEIRNWAAGLGIETFQASSGRVYPKEMKAAPLLRRWVDRLRGLQVRFHMLHRLCKIENDPLLRLHFKKNAGKDSAENMLDLFYVDSPDAVILALGGASWPITGSNGAWTSLLDHLGVNVPPLVAANCGWELEWPADLLDKIEGLPLKNCRASADGEYASGELMITRYGLEGGIIYTLGAALRRMQEPVIEIDLKPSAEIPELLRKMESVKRNLIAESRTRWRLSEQAHALLVWQAELRGIEDPARLAELVKHFPLSLRGPRPIAEAISSAGGIAWRDLTKSLSLQGAPAIFFAGEMIDWEAPTGGYLMQGCFATGRRAARSAMDYLRQKGLY